MTYLYLTLSLFWFPVQLPVDPCGLTSVICPHEDPVYIQEYIRDEFNKAGLDGDLAVKISWLESRHKLDAIGYNKNGSNDKGVWQINSIHGLSDDCLLDLECSTDWAINKVKRDGGFSAWTTLKLIK